MSSADFGPKGLAVIHFADAKYRIEYPLGKTVYESSHAWLSHMRVSPDGRWIAFIEHATTGDDAGMIGVIPATGGERKLLTKQFASAQGLAWAPRDDEIWFTASPSATNTTIYGVKVNGASRTILNAPGRFLLQDIAADGRAMVNLANERRGNFAHGPAGPGERDLTIFDWGIPRAISNDGRWVLLDESGEGGGGEGSV